jgi:hypothetical protein
MGEFSQNILNERPDSHTARAFYNPNKDKFEQEVKSASFSILDIGCGYPPRLSWKLKSDQLWVGCDPSIPKRFINNIENTIQVSSIFKNPDGKYVVYNDVVADVPQFYPDVISVIAPNQKDIHNGYIFDDDLKKFLSPVKNQYLFTILDKRTFEDLGYRSSALREIKDWMIKYNFKRENVRPILPCKFSPNSADLGESNIHIYGIRRATE